MKEIIWSWIAKIAEWRNKAARGIEICWYQFDCELEELMEKHKAAILALRSSSLTYDCLC